MNSYKRLIFLLLITCCPLSLCGQQVYDVDTLVQDIIELRFNNEQIIVSQANSDSLASPLHILSTIRMNYGTKRKQDSILIATLPERTNNTIQAVANNLSKGFFTLHYNPSNTDAYRNFREALRIAENEESKQFQKLAHIGILEYYIAQKTPNTKNPLTNIEKLFELSASKVDSTIAAFYMARYSGLVVNDESLFWTSFEQLLKRTNQTALPLNWQSKTSDLLMSYFREAKKLDSLEKYAQRILDLPETNYTKEAKYYAYLELSALEAMRGNKEKALNYLTISNQNTISEDSIQNLFTYNRFVAMKVLAPMGEYEAAYKSLERSNVYEAMLNTKENKEIINQLEVQLQTAETEKQLLVSEQQKKQNRNIAVGLGGGIIAVTLIGFLLFKNTKRKQRIAEQQSELEIQKTEKILKEQELVTIDAMIEGQEKERQRLAGDLHDSVGATLAAAKLQFHHLSINREKGAITEELFDKTGKLLEDAYNEIRTMAHIKNSGVIAKNGLLPAVQKLARNASGANGLTIEVEDYGLEDRLDNLMEITIFRVIQELVTNIIKHAKATEASIAINKYEDSLSIIIEDNGQGFDARQLPEKDGMGLSSIEKRIEHLEGTMEIDSTPGKGTHILIDIPL